MHGIFLFLSGSCLKTEVFKQLYYKNDGFLTDFTSLDYEEFYETI
jgi:hypothetical protein